MHVLMRFCHLNKLFFVCKAKEGRHIRIIYIFTPQSSDKSVGVTSLCTETRKQDDIFG